MSILLQETGGGTGNGSAVTATAAATIGDGADMSSLAMESEAATKESCLGDCQFGRSWKQYVELLAQKTVIDVGDEDGDDVNEGDNTQREAELPPENGCGCKADSVSSECNASEKTTQQQQQQQQQHQPHSERLFPLKCCCRMCFVSREVVMQLYAEDCQYNSLWDRLQLLMKQYYDLIPEYEDNALNNQYTELTSKSSLKWLTDARFNRKNIIQMSLASNLPLSNEMAFVMLTNVLSTRDPHQLFELLCFQLRSIVQVYYAGFEDLFTESTENGSRQFSAPDVLNYIVNGYNKLRQSARTVTPLLCVLEQRHLGKFGLSWWLINQRIFQRYFYYEVRHILAECMLRLRGSLPEREYQELVGRFVKFDEEMTDISFLWAEVWPLLYTYHRSSEDRERRQRINVVHALLQTIRESRYTPKSPALFEKPDRPIEEWLDLDNRKLVWEYVVHCLKTKWIPGVDSRLSTVADTVKCPSCNLPSNTHYIKCVCQTCIIGGGIFNFRPKKEINESCLMCTCINTNEILQERECLKILEGDEMPTLNGHQDSPIKQQNGCMVGAKKDTQPEDVLPSLEAPADGQELYHIAWAIFKHLPNRVAYKWSTLEPSRFCMFQTEPCSAIACRVAINIIAMNYPFNLSRELIHSYQPVSDEPRRFMKGNLNTKARNSLLRFCDNVNKRWHEEMDDQMHPLLFVDMFWSLQNSALNLPKTRASDLAEWFMFDMQAPPRNVLYQYFTKFFLVKANDIAFDLECFEREREWTDAPNRVRESIMHKLESNVGLLAPLPPPGGSASAASLSLSQSSSSSSSSCSSSSSSCLSSSNTSSSSACSLSTSSAATVAVAAAAAATAAASSFIEPMIDSCLTSHAGSTNDRRCTCDSCVNEILSKTETLFNQFDAPVENPELTQRTIMLEMKVKALLKERNMLLEKGRDMNECQVDPNVMCRKTFHHQLGCDKSCTATSISPAQEPSKDALNVVGDGIAVSASPLPDVVKSVTPREDEGANNTAKSANSPSKASLNENSPKLLCEQYQQQQQQKTVSDEQSQTPGKLASFAKAAAAKIATQKATAAVAVPKIAGSVRPTSSATSQPPVTAATSQTHTASKPCPCGLPSHASSTKSAGVSKAKPPSTLQAGVATSAPVSGTKVPGSGTKEDPKKTPCHRGGAAPPVGGAGAPSTDKVEGSCVCYYCTLFGQSECNHNQRTNETREKLRKKLQKQQMMNDKLFNEERQRQQQQQQRQQKSATSTSGTVAAKDSQPPPVKSTTAVTATSSPSVAATTAAKIGNTPNLSAPTVAGTKVVQNPDKSSKKPLKPDTPGSTPSIDDLLRFIEGDDSAKGGSKGANKPTRAQSSTEKGGGHKHAPPATANQKAAPTAAKDPDTMNKAKLNESLKLIGELDILRQMFYDCQSQEQMTKQLLQVETGLTRKERKDLQSKIQMYRQQKNDLHAGINALLSCIRSYIPEYPFKLEAFTAPVPPLPSQSCCPVSGSQYQYAKGVLHGASASGTMLPPPPSTALSAASAKATGNVRPTTFAKLQETLSLFQQKKQQQLDEVHQKQGQTWLQHLNQLKQQQQQADLNEPSARQMVTIKRTFLSHAEPQVTVTAKGDTPEHDQILYTFIDGQMVPINGSTTVGDTTLQNQRTQQQQRKPWPPAMNIPNTKPTQSTSPQKLDDPLADFTPQEQRLIKEYVDQLYQQPLEPALLEETGPSKRSSRAKKKSGIGSVSGESQDTISLNALIHERMLRQSVELIKNLQSDRKGNPDMLTLANKVKKNLLEIQKNPKAAPTSVTSSATATSKSNVSSKAQKESVAKPAAEKTKQDIRQGSKGKAAQTDSTDKGKNKNDLKKDKLIEEIDEIVARLNLLDSDEEESTKPAAKRKQKSSGDAKTLNRKQSKDSIVSGGSGSGTGAKQQHVKPQQTGTTTATTKTTTSQGDKRVQSAKSAKKDTATGATPAPTSAATKEEPKKIQPQPAAADTATKPTVVRKKAAKTFIDPEFDNNAFRLLNLDESESEIEEEILEEAVSLVKSPTKLGSAVDVSTPPPPTKKDSESTVGTKKNQTKESALVVTGEPGKAKQSASGGGSASVATAQKPSSTIEKEKKTTQKKATAKQQQPPKRNEADSGGGANTAASSGNDAESRTKKLTPAQAMVEKISALLDSPGLSNRQRKHMIRQLEQAQATIQSQLLQNAAKSTKAKVQAQAQQEKIANQKASIAALSKTAAAIGKEPSVKQQQQQQQQPSRTSNATAPTPATVGTGTGTTNSLMDQLRRGIRAEGLDLPPGITLTRLDAIQSEALRMKRESIRKICEPMKPVAPDPTATVFPTPNAPGMFVVNPMEPLFAAGNRQESVIMVNTGKMQGKEQHHQHQQDMAGTDRKKRNKRRNKNKNKDLEPSANGSHASAAGISGSASMVGGTSSVATSSITSKLADGSNIVTLRNPMFHGGPMSAGGAGGVPAMRAPGAPMMPDVQGARMTLGYDQPATIFKNDNGMFTIRNPALHHALSGGAPPEATGFRPFNAAYLVENGIVAPSGPVNAHQAPAMPLVTAAVSSSSGAGDMMSTGSGRVPPYLQQFSSPTVEDGTIDTRKCKSVIGSEMKNAQKQKQNSLQQQQQHQLSGRNWQHMNGVTGHDLFAAPVSSAGAPIGSGRAESHYSAYNQYNLAGQSMLHSAGATGYGGSGSMLGPTAAASSSPSSGYYHGAAKGTAGAIAIGSERSQGLSYLGGADPSGGLAAHCCDDDAPSPYFNGGSLGALSAATMASRHRYDDLAFLQNLQPGQRLNSEVTIHSINDSKMRRPQAQNYAHDIQITPIPAPSPPAGVRGGLGVPVSSGNVSLHHLIQQTQRQQPHPAQDGGPVHLSDLSPGSGSVCSGSGSASRTGVTLNDFMDNCVASGGSSSTTSTDLLAPSMELDTKCFLHDYQLGQLQQQMQDLQLQSQQQSLSGDFRDNVFTSKQPIVGASDREVDEQDLESLERFNYFFNAPGGCINNGGNISSSKGRDLACVNPSSAKSTPVAKTSPSAEEDNPGGVSIGGEELHRPQQPPIGTPSSKSSLQQQRLQQNATPVSSGAGTILYPATADSPASSVSVFDGISSSLSSQAHSFDDLYTDLLSSASPPTSIAAGTTATGTGCNMNVNLHNQANADTSPFSRDASTPSNVNGHATGSAADNIDCSPTV